MHITADIFSDPAMQSSLKKYYESQKSKTIEILRSREQTFSGEVKIQMDNGQQKTVDMVPIDTEKMVDAIVGFDKWLAFQKASFESPMFNAWEVAQQRLTQVEANHPDSSSRVRATFSNKGVLLAYVNAEGAVVTSNGADKYIASSNGSGESIEAIVHSIKNTLSEYYPHLKTETYSADTSPTKREFSRMWQSRFDIDERYNEALSDAQEHWETMDAWHAQWQKNMDGIRSFLLSLQEA